MATIKGKQKMPKPHYGISRRDFVSTGAAALGTLAALPTFARTLAAQPGGQKKVIHIMGYSHIDAAWLWPWRDGSDEALNTFRSALNRMIETPDFCYSHSSSAHYRWVERADPAMFAEIQQRVKESRWEVIGGWPVEPDCNIPSAESFVRHSLYGKEYCKRTMGADVTVGFNPDSFGHAAGLPTILKNAGYGYYSFMRPSENDGVYLPLLFWWEGADGSRVLTLRLLGYDNDADELKQAATENFAPGFDHAAFILGVGDHGGAVTKEQIRQVLALRKDRSLPELRFDTFRGFFSAVESSPAFASLPVVRNELQHHARGCYSANSEGKFLNRRAERGLGEAETLSLVTSLSAGHAYPADQYAESWWKVLFCQFHDMMAGTSLYSDYKDVRDSVGYACEVAETAKVEALETLAKRVDLSGVEEGAAFLFNPLPWRRKALVEYYTDRNPSGAPGKEITHLVSKDGVKVPLQWRPSASMSNFVPRLSAWVELPPLGYKVFQLGHGDAPNAEDFPTSLTVSNSGFGISSVKAEDGAELLAGPVGLIVIADTADTWAHGIDSFRLEMGRPTLMSSTVIENGPITRVTRQIARWMDSEIVLDIAEFAGLDFVELRFVIDWHQQEQMLKLEIPTALSEPRFFAKVPGQVLERKVNGEEEPYQDWGAVEGTIGSNQYTLALLNAQTYSYDCLNGLFRTVLIRSAPFARHNPAKVPHNDNNAWQDQGRQERTFWLMGAKSAATDLALDRRTEELQTPAEYVQDSAHRGTEPWEQSFLEIMPSSVWALAIKRPEGEQDGTIIRIQERAGKAVQASLKSSALGLDHSLELSAWELKTLFVKSAKGRRAEVREVSLLEA
jgi:alpha-mannosidase